MGTSSAVGRIGSSVRVLHHLAGTWRLGIAALLLQPLLVQTRQLSVKRNEMSNNKWSKYQIQNIAI